MEPILIYPVVSILCFIFAIFFFRKKGVPMNNVLFPFITSLYNPVKMKEHFKTEGIGLIIMGYLSFIAFMVMRSS
ncbi:MAG: hypothetical protein CVU64_20020 [Deltaproteobacteria bacterium HGW-Deltaproteobacteria-21]|nr:MAG: hypothetical protein CVU64_20020 [Deltaproteobacteria bacterium HGW-Deltaproteobacteria-21]